MSTRLYFRNALFLPQDGRGRTSAAASSLLLLAIVTFGAFITFGEYTMLSLPDAFGEEPSYAAFDTPRFILYIGDNKRAGSNEKVDAAQVAKQSIAYLNTTHDELSRIFEQKPSKKIVLRFLSPEEFRKQTGAPSWTSAMYFRDEITIPLSGSLGSNTEELNRALRHEYVHAFIADFSSYRCPAWLDEGVAQLLEGPPNPLLGPALRQWIAQNPAIPLNWLQNGFTTLDNDIVPAAYAESLFAARELIHLQGFRAVTDYLHYLHEGKSEPRAFFLAFGTKEFQFEQELTLKIKHWSESPAENP